MRLAYGEKKFDYNRILGDLKSRVRVPARRLGAFEIVHKIVPAGEKMTVVSLRNSLFMGYQPLSVVFTVPHKLTQLLEDGGVWMTDSPQEIFTLAPGIDAARGHVLVGGLGIGYAAQKIADSPRVLSVTVVEKSPEVIALVKPYLACANVDVVCADLFEFLRTTRCRFDYCYFDIWASTGERELSANVRPLRKLAKRVLNEHGRVKCWGEEEMRGQVEHGRQARRLMAGMKP